MKPPRILVLIGPPGAGKTHLGRVLSRELGWDFRETERGLMEKYGSREAFLGHKQEALAGLEAEYRRCAEEEGPLVLLESTGLSDHAMLMRLAQEHRVVFVKVWANADLCAGRVASRPAGANFNNDAEWTRGFHAFWNAEVAPLYMFDAELRNEGLDTADVIHFMAGLIAGSAFGET